MSQADLVTKEMKRAIEKLAINMLSDIHGKLILRTPVDTGWARSNWLPSITNPIESPSGTRENVNSISGVGVIFRWRFEQGSAFISNNVPYISELNAGSSKQAPSMFVESAIQIALAKFARAQLR